MKLTVLLFLVSFCALGIQATTHWMVTETGLIQPKDDSPFLLARPFDLLAFLNQDARWDNIIILYQDLYRRRVKIKHLWLEIERDTDLSIHFGRDANCLKHHPATIDWYTSYLEDGSARNIPDEEFMIYTFDNRAKPTNVPDCKKISSLTFSMATFEHLEGMLNRGNLSMPAENTLPDQISPIMSIDQFGHWLAGVLKKNSSSWLHYNMASLFWRAKGNAVKAIECSRRAVHYAPRQYKGIALLSMGTIFHMSQRAEDAIIVLTSSLEHDPLPITHYTIANAYAVFGDFNSSVRHYQDCMAMDPQFKQATKNVIAVRCHAALMEKMDTVKENLLMLEEELKDYLAKESLWMKAQTALLRTMKNSEGFDFSKVENVCNRVSELTGLNMRDLKRLGDKHYLIQYFVIDGRYDNEWLHNRGVHCLESLKSLQAIVEKVENQAHMRSELVSPHDEIDFQNHQDGELIEEIGPTPLFNDAIDKNRYQAGPGDNKKEEENVKVSVPNSEPDTSFSSENDMEYEMGVALYPNTMKVVRNTEDFDKMPDWPSPKYCKEHSDPLPDSLDSIYPTFLPFENKGIRLKALLTDKIGVPANVEHELPWHPPTCPQDKSVSTLKKSPKQLSFQLAQVNYLRKQLMEYLGDGDVDSVSHMQDAEIGQRIHSAMEMDVAPKWLVYTLASLYWRVRGNNANALHCLLAANKMVKPRHRDVVMTSLASVYLEMGYFDEALAASEEAFRISFYEPATNFLLAELNMVKTHQNTLLFHLKQVVRVDPNFLGGLVRRLLINWACVLKQIGDVPKAEIRDVDLCAQVHPTSKYCDKNNENCEYGKVQCFTSRERDSTRVVKMFEQSQRISDSDEGPNFLDSKIFDPFLAVSSSKTSDKAKHQESFMAMMSLVKRLKGCGKRGCLAITAEELELQESDCFYQHMQQGYWLHIVALRQLRSDTELRIPKEIITLNPSYKKMPDCRLPDTLDFVLERLSAVETAGWETVPTLMQQFSEAAQVSDFGILGQKIAKYVDGHPTSWLGALSAGWWCGAGGRGACAARCLASAYAHAPPDLRVLALRTLAALLHIQGKHSSGKKVGYLSFYLEPKNKIEAFLVAVSHTYLEEFDQAVWMYRYSLSFDPKYLATKACLHSTMCFMLFGTVPHDTDAPESNDYIMGQSSSEMLNVS